MSIKETMDLVCPACGKSAPTVVWRSLNADLDPLGKNDLMDGQINVFRCPGCHNQARVETDFLYHDMTIGFMAYHFPFDNVRNREFLERFDENGQIKLDPGYLLKDFKEYFNHVHFCFEMQELIRYILFRESLYGKMIGGEEA